MSSNLGTVIVDKYISIPDTNLPLFSLTSGNIVNHCQDQINNTRELVLAKSFLINALVNTWSILFVYFADVDGKYFIQIHCNSWFVSAVNLMSDNFKMITIYYNKLAKVLIYFWLWHFLGWLVRFTACQPMLGCIMSKSILLSIGYLVLLADDGNLFKKNPLWLQLRIFSYWIILFRVMNS